MKKEIRMNHQQTSIPAEKTPVQVFRCPKCSFADTCSDCSYFGTNEECLKWGGYTSADHWACSWYYEH